MKITHARTNDSLRRSRARRVSLLGWLPLAAAVALSGCTVKKTETPDPTGPSELGLSLQLQLETDGEVVPKRDTLRLMPEKQLEPLTRLLVCTLS